ncbi:MAG: hypothetical protein A3A44_00710 [Candidatus Sungbacteria bacterium RIFCSPLOWO2_01_FULL_60_25]|uniref:Cytidylyltransferase n=1 Tax=Candidatus Sungbacteria bacterium RIFCSPLOWO2_01_FULL_60_25 TaxID=1802281 RepID=A0A1G2LAM8_9BACT|nr:MAG: hypothetical protein A3A44_00710 [Candidatus Sungbacteria bacterium RIFCSPLOWO2_01_FULL_60_25]
MYNGKKIIALIPARGGSKGVPRKNIRLLGGLPLIAYSIRSAQAAASIDRVIVSTDDAEIAAIARTYGAEVPFLRPVEFAQDLTPDYPVFAHCLAWLEWEEGYRPDIVVHLRPTGPLRTPAQIDRAVELLERHPEADSVRSVHEPDKTPHKMWRPEGEFMVPFLRDAGIAEHVNTPRQLLPKVYATNANIGIVRYRTLVEKRSVIGDTVLPLLITEPWIDIDTDFDFEIAEYLLARRRTNAGKTSGNEPNGRPKRRAP